MNLEAVIEKIWALYNYMSTKILEVILFAFAYRLFHEDF